MVYIKSNRILAWWGMVLMSAMLITGCSMFKDDKDDEVTLPAETLYANAMEELKNKKYTKAVETFDDLERTYPYSPLATNAQLMAAYAHYEAQAYDEAVAALERFIKFHPGHKSTPYAYYLKGLCYYDQITDIGREQSITQQAETSLKEVVARYPSGEYARDARLKLDLVRDHLAGKEMAIGRFYLKKGRYVAAINRFKQVIETYQTTSHIPEAMHRMVESYIALGILPEARRYAAVLGHNYPGSEWYQRSYTLIVSKNPPAQLAKDGHLPDLGIDLPIPFMHKKGEGG